MPAEVTTASVEQVIFDGLAEVGAEREQISREANFEDLDVDSLDLVMSVSMKPGATALAEPPSAATSGAVARVCPITPAFEKA